MIILRRTLDLAIVMFFILVVIGCGTENSYTDHSFREGILLSKQERSLEFKFRPGDLWVVGDSLIVIGNQGCRDSLYVVLRGEDWSVKRIFGKRGDAEDEFNSHRILKYPGGVTIYDSERGRVAAVYDEKVDFYDFSLPQGDSTYELFYADSTVLYENFSRSSVGALISVKDDERKVIREFADIVKLTHDPYGYRGVMGVNPHSGRVVYAYQYLRRFDIYESDGQIVSLNVDKTAEPPVIYKNQLDRLNSTIHYNGVSVTPERIYLYYIGLSPREVTESENITYVEEFDWDGNPIKRYKLDGYYSFVAYQGGKFVCVSPSLESQFVTYSIE